jgi:hypothetical protein
VTPDEEEYLSGLAAVKASDDEVLSKLGDPRGQADLGFGFADPEILEARDERDEGATAYILRALVAPERNTE